MPDLDLTTAHPLLADTLQMAVPLRIAELRAAPPDQLLAMARQIQHGDDVLYGGTHTAADTGALITTLAVLALTAEGGVDFAGMHWCTVEHDVCPARPVFGHLGPHELPVPAPRPKRRAVTTAPLASGEDGVL